MSIVVDKMFEIVVSYKANGYHVHGNIPNKKLEAAFQHYPDVDVDDVILALVDSTVFGSAKTGMLIGANGVYWNNDWAVKTNRNSLSWDELADSRWGISKSTFDIQLAPGCELGMSGCSMSKDNLINLLNRLIKCYKQELENIQIVTIEEDKEENIPIQNSTEKTGLYNELIPEILALCMVADGNIEDTEVETATEIIEGDDYIVDKQKALEQLTQNIEKYLAEREKSKAVFKLKVSSILAKIPNLESSLHKERLKIIAESMLESVGNDGLSETAALIDNISAKTQQ